MLDTHDPIDQRLLEDFQRNLPLEPHPFLAIAARLGTSEEDVITRLKALRDDGKIARVGGTCRPNTVGASTLAAVAVPEGRDIEAVAALIGEEPGVNHSYLREHSWNIWFVATAPEAQALQESLQRIEARTDLKVLNLPLVRPFNIDLGFRLAGPRHVLPNTLPPNTTVLKNDDAPIMQAMASGLDLVPAPFKALAESLERTEIDVLDRIAILRDARLLTRVGIIVRHRPLGWKSNAMVVWKVPEHRIEAAGLALSAVPGITLCYQRKTVPGVWDYSLFSMIHARSREEAHDVLREAENLQELNDIEHESLFSLKCFKQTGALVHKGEAA